jgi:hypothetical protein
MKTRLNETKRMQQLAGVLKEEEKVPNEVPNDAENKDVVDTTSELSKQFMNIRQFLSNGTVKMDKLEIQGMSKILDLLANKANQGSIGTPLTKFLKIIDSTLAGIGEKK